MAEIAHRVDDLKLGAGRLCLDFANTAEWHASDLPQEHLTSYSELVYWSRGGGILTDQQAQHLLQEAAQRPEEAAAVLERAIALREALYHLFSAIAHQLAPGTADLDIFNAALSETMARSRLIPTDGKFAWDWVDDDTLDQVLWPVAWSAAQLLTSEELDRVGECADERGCGWLFLDMSRNRSRRWCDMGECGNRAKARRSYQRQRAAGSPRA